MKARSIDPTSNFFRALLQRDGFELERRDLDYYFPCFGPDCIRQRINGLYHLPTMCFSMETGIARCGSCRISLNVVDYLTRVDKLTESEAIQLAIKGRRSKKAYVLNSRKARLA